MRPARAGPSAARSKRFLHPARFGLAVGRLWRSCARSGRRAVVVRPVRRCVRVIDPVEGLQLISRQWRGLLFAAGLAALFLWIVSKTEWVEDDVPRELAGEAATNDRYVLKRVLQGIGARTVERDDLSQLPPPGASLLLSAWNWDLLPDRNKALRAWVERGGNLVIEGGLLSS